MLPILLQIAHRAGAAALAHYGAPLPVEHKADDSPLTLADRASHELIVRELAERFPDIPTLSEESPPEQAERRHEWERYFLVDPLDGTKEFIKQTGEFTVNIALVDGTEAVLGVIYVPALGVTYYAERGGGAFRQEGEGEPRRIGVRKADPERPVIVASRDHAGPMVKELFERFPQAETRSMGSSLKFCLVAEGKADIYLRDVPTMEWDTAAAQAVVEEAGGQVTLLDGTPLSYNKADLRNPSLVTLGDATFHWQ